MTVRIAYVAPDVAALPCDPVSGSMSRWYVVQTEPVSEFLALNGLALLAGITAYLPTEVRRRRKMRHGRPVFENGKPVREETIRAFFPGYLFARFDARDPAWGAILRTRGVKRLFCHASGQPIPVADVAVEAIQARGRAGDGAIDLEAPAFAPLAPGMRVRIPDGPFADLAAVVQWTDQRRVEVLLGLLRVTVDRRTVELVA